MKGTLTGRCASCREQHPESSECPPHEVRISGFAWFKVYIDELEDKVERLQARLETANKMIQANRTVIQADAREIERLQAIVDKLPKTADGVSVVAGSEVWLPHAIMPKAILRQLANAPVPHSATVRWSEDWKPKGSFDVAIYRQGKRIDCGYSVEQCYSTREAAEGEVDVPG